MKQDFRDVEVTMIKLVVENLHQINLNMTVFSAFAP